MPFTPAVEAAVIQLISIVQLCDTMEPTQDLLVGMAHDIRQAIDSHPVLRELVAQLDTDDSIGGLM